MVVRTPLGQVVMKGVTKRSLLSITLLYQLNSMSSLTLSSLPRLELNSTDSWHMISIQGHVHIVGTRDTISNDPLILSI